MQNSKNCGATYVKFQIFDINEQISKFAKTANYQKKNTKTKYERNGKKI